MIDYLAVFYNTVLCRSYVDGKQRNETVLQRKTSDDLVVGINNLKFVSKNFVSFNICL